MKTALFISYGGGHVNSLSPVYREILGDKSVESYYLACTTAMTKLESLGLPYTTYGELLEGLYSADEKQKIQYWGEFLSQGLEGGMLPKSETMAYLGVNYYELVLDIGVVKAQQQYKALGRRAFHPLGFCRRVCKEINPDIIITTSSPRTEQSFIEIGHELNIKTICLLDLYDENFVRNFLSKKDYATKVGVFEASITKIVEHGRDQEDLVPTGNPAFDYLLDITGDQKKSFREKFDDDFSDNLKCEKPIIVFMKSQTGFKDELEDQILDRLITYSQEMNFSLGVRHHPNDSQKLLPSRHYVLCDEEGLASVIGGLDILVTVISTVGYEASIVNKSVIQVLSHGYKPATHFQELGIGKTTYIDKDFKAKLELEVFRQRESERTTRCDTGELSATKKVYNLIFEMIGTS